VHIAVMNVSTKNYGDACANEPQSVELKVTTSYKMSVLPCQQHGVKGAAGGAGGVGNENTSWRIVDNNTCIVTFHYIEVSL